MNTLTNKIKLLTIITSFVFISGCSYDRIDLPNDLTKTAESNIHQEFTSRNSEGIVENSWLKTFNDETLNSLVKEALENNPNLKVAGYKIDQAEAQTEIAKSALKPSLGYAGRVSETNAGGAPLSLVGVRAGWEFDVWGRLSAQVQSSEATKKSVEADYSGAKQALVANVSKSWFALIEASNQEILSKQILDSYVKTYDSVKIQYEIGKTLRKDLSKAKAEVDSATDSYVQTQIAHKKSARALEILLGRYPSASIVSNAELPKLSPFPSTGVPSDLLSRRPDLVSKEEAVRSAFFASENARLSRLPSFSLSPGSISSSLGQTLSEIALGVSGPLYEGGAISAEIQYADATQKKALASYEATVLNAFQDVEHNLETEEYIELRLVALKEAVKNYKLALEDTQIQYDIGQVDITILQTQQAKLSGAQSTYLHVQTLLLQNRVNIYLSLGGGFDENNSLGGI